METQMKKEILLTRIFDAPRELVFKAWTDPGLVAQWWGPDMFTILTCEVDARTSGTIFIVMHGPDGVDYPMKGVFREIIPPERIVFFSIAMEDEQGNSLMEVLTTVTLEEIDGKTKLTLRAEAVKALPEAAFALSGMEAGWSQSIEKLAKLLAQNEGQDA